MLAFIKIEPNYNVELLRELRDELKQEGFLVKIIDNFKQYKKYIDVFSGKCLYFKNEYIRLHNKKAIFNYIENNSSSIFSDSNGEIIGFDLSKLDYNFDDHLINFHQFDTFFLNIQSYRKEASPSPPFILIYSKQRTQFLDITLKSLTFSLGDDFKNHRVALVLNEDSPEARHVALKHKHIFPNIEINVPETNLGAATMNILLQKYDKISPIKNFIVCEDDFILPTKVKDLYPQWTRQFDYHLTRHDLVGWSVSKHNKPLNETHFAKFPGIYAFSRFISPINNQIGKSQLWCNSYEENFSLGAQALGLSYEYYKKCASQIDNRCPADSTLQKNASTILTPTLSAYHLGWDQEIFGYGSLLSSNKWPSVAEEHTLLELKEDRLCNPMTLKVSDILKS